MARYLYSEIASRIDARKRCVGNEWYVKHEDTILHLVKNYMPSGSGIDSGTTIDLDKSHADKLVFYTSFHHMNDVGYYDGWTEHTVVVTPSLTSKFNLRISGRNRNDIKELLYQEFDHCLSSLVRVSDVGGTDEVQSRVNQAEADLSRVLAQFADTQLPQTSVYRYWVSETAAKLANDLEFSLRH